MQNEFNAYLNKLIAEYSLEEDDKISLVLEIINDLLEAGSIQNGAGYCLAMSDLLQKILSYNDIECELVECSLLVVDANFTPTKLTMIGYEHNSKTDVDHMQNHVALITKTKVPLLIDLSVFGRAEGVPYVIGIFNDKPNKKNSSSLSSIKINNVLYKYSKKPISSIPYLHQQSIIEKIKHDEKVSKDLHMIKKLILILFFISGSNLIRGMYDHYQKYVVKDNGFGPNKEVIVHKE